MGVSKNPLFYAGDTDAEWGYGRWTGWSAQALLLGYLDQNPMYNAANFSLGPGCSGGMVGSAANSTVYNSRSSNYLCRQTHQCGGLA